MPARSCSRKNNRTSHSLCMLAGALLLTLLVNGRGASGPATTFQGGLPRRFTLFYTSAIQGTLEPCGCTSDPLGGLDRFAGLVREARRKGPVLFVDGGNLTFPLGGGSESRRAAGMLRARFLARELTKLGLRATAPGAGDLASGLVDATDTDIPWLAVNLPGVPGIARSRLETVGGVRVGLFGVADPDVTGSAGRLRPENPLAAAEAEAHALRKSGAELVIAIVAGDRGWARRIAARADVDFVVLGKATGTGLPHPIRVGKAYLVGAGEELTQVGRLEIVLRPNGGALVDAGSPEELAQRQAELDARIAELNAQLARWQRQTDTNDPAFVAQKAAALAALNAERKAYDGKDWRPPEDGSFFVNRILPIRRALPRDPQVTRAMKTLDRAIAKVNLAAATPPPPPEPGRAHFVGDAACARCHQAELRFWKRTVHARAFHTLVRDGKQFDHECVSCHVTGYGEVGGSALGFTRDRARGLNLEAVQCEACHGPGSIHVAEQGLEEPLALRLDAPETLCIGCHNEKHSDTFQYEAYLRDVLGPGHGAARRARLGPGPTGHELRRAALMRAKEAGKDAVRAASARL